MTQMHLGRKGNGARRSIETSRTEERGLDASRVPAPWRGRGRVGVLKFKRLTALRHPEERGREASKVPSP
jgi:hypothetical protein